MEDDIETDQPASPQADRETYSIDEIKGVRNNDEEEAKKPRKKKEPIERFTTEHLIQEKGIPELMIKGRRLYLRDKVTILKKSDAVMQMYRSWAANDYGLVRFEDFLTRSLAMSTKPEIRHMLDNYRDMEMQKYVSAESGELESGVPDSVPTVAAVVSGEGEKELDLDGDGLSVGGLLSGSGHVSSSMPVVGLSSAPVSHGPDSSSMPVIGSTPASVIASSSASAPVSSPAPTSSAPVVGSSSGPVSSPVSSPAPASSSVPLLSPTPASPSSPMPPPSSTDNPDIPDNQNTPNNPPPTSLTRLSDEEPYSVCSYIRPSNGF